MTKKGSQRNCRGFFEIGIYNPKTEDNVGTLWRSAYQLGASGIFIISPRFGHFRRQSSDTLKTWRHIPCREFQDFNSFSVSIPLDTALIAIEIGDSQTLLEDFKHPERAIYLLGPEDKGLPISILEKCVSAVSIGSIRTQSYNVAVAGSIIMWHRMTERASR